MDALYIKQSTRPNLYKLTESELLNIINYYEPEWMNNKYTRDDMVAKIFKLWSEYVLIDHNSNPIECLICWDYLTNGNNMTFECGHKFHSSCIVKSLLIHSTETYINKMNNEEIKENFMVEYCCPQCKNCIDKIQFIK